MTSEDHELYGEAFSQQIRLYREDLQAAAETAAARLEQARALWAQVCRSLPRGAPPPGDDFDLMFAFMMAIDVGRADEAERLYALVPSDVRAELDAAEDANPGQFKIWSTER